MGNDDVKGNADRVVQNLIHIERLSFLDENGIISCGLKEKCRNRQHPNKIANV